MPKTKAATRPASTVEPLWTDADVSAYFAGKITTKTLMNWRSIRYGPPVVKFGTTILYDPDSVKAWAKAQERLNGEAAAA